MANRRKVTSVVARLGVEPRVSPILRAIPKFGHEDRPMPDLDLSLAILHHFFVFALFGVLFSEFVVVRRGINAAAAARVAGIDA